MSEIIYGSLLFSVAFALHIFLWRIYLPRRQTKTLLLIFFGMLLLGSSILAQFDKEIAIFGIHPPTEIVGYFRIWLFVVALILAYMITYSAVEADSPSLVIVLKIAQTGTSGLKEESLFSELNDDALIVPRIRDLVRDKMAAQAEGKYRLRPKGVILARLFQLYRNLMGAGKGG